MSTERIIVQRAVAEEFKEVLFKKTDEILPSILPTT